MASQNLKRLSPDPIPVKTESDVLDAISQVESFKGFRLGDILVTMGVIEIAQLEKYAQESKPPLQKLGQRLLKERLINHQQLHVALLAQNGIPFVDVSQFKPSSVALKKVSHGLASQWKVVPLFADKNELVVACTNPGDLQLANILKFQTGLKIFLIGASTSQLEGLVRRMYGGDLEDVKNVRIERQGTVIEMDSEIARKNRSLLLQAIHRNASDIHFKPNSKDVEVYLRIDGRMVHIDRVPKQEYGNTVRRFKVVGGMDVTNARKPQDGSAQAWLGDGRVDLRVSTMPTVYGESIVIRLSDQRSGTPSIEDIGIYPEDVDFIRETIDALNGLFLVTGPTGSGKSHTLYAMLGEAAKNPINVMTVEDPVERDVKGCLQVEVSEAEGYTFPVVLRHLLRHDPDAVMVGEIRDEETATMLNRIALSGHLAFSTLHSRETSSVPERIMDMGVPAYTLADTLKGVMSQRLVRMLCPDCKISRTINDRSTLDLLECDEKEHRFFIAGSGCPKCFGSGAIGRAMVYELMKVDDAIRDAISQRASPVILRQMSLRNGMTPMSSKAAAMAKEGIIDVQEALTMVRSYSSQVLSDTLLPELDGLDSFPAQKLTIYK